jgi:hypothetical protein
VVAAETLLDRLAELTGRAEAQDPTALPELRRLLDESPALWDALGDLARHAELTLIDAVVGVNTLAKEALVAKLTGLKQELAGESPSPLERLLCERVVACWLAVNEVDLTAAGARGLSLAQAKFHEHRRDRAHQRFLQATKTLAIVRKLLRPAPSPVEVATRLGAGAAPRPAGRRNALGQGVAVSN